MKATNIIWDVDCKKDLKCLPTEIEIPDGMTDEDEISDYLSDVTGYCHNGFELADRKETVYVISVTETLSRCVVVVGKNGESREEVVEFVEELANNGVIDLDGKDFCGREVKEETEDWEGVDTDHLAVFECGKKRYSAPCAATTGDGANDTLKMTIFRKARCVREELNKYGKDAFGGYSLQIWSCLDGLLHETGLWEEYLLWERTQKEE